MDDRLTDRVTDGAAAGTGASAVTESVPKTDADGRIAAAAYTPGEDYYTETIFLQSLKKRRVLRLGGILLILLSGIQMIREVPEFQRFMLLGALSLSGLFFFLYAQYAHVFKGRSAIRKIRREAGGEKLPRLVHDYYADRIEIHAEGSDRVRTYSYSEITDIRQTKDMTLFVFGRQYSISVPHKAFHFGTAEQVQAYVRANFRIKRFS